MSLYPYKPKAGQRVQGDAGSGVGRAPNLDAAFIVHYQASPVAAANANVLTATTLPTSGTTTVTAGITNPDVGRCVQIVGNQAGITGNVTINGTNLAGDTISEVITANGTTVVVGTKAFKTVTSVVLPTRNGAGDTISVGMSAKLGLHHKLPHNTVMRAFLNNALEGTAPTVVVSAATLELNVMTLNSALNGNVVDAYYYV